jgi:hypothetical protein
LHKYTHFNTKMSLQNRIQNLCQLGLFYQQNESTLPLVKENANYQNAWFIPTFIDLALQNIATQFLQKETLESFAQTYNIQEEITSSKKVGIVMAGNIPLVGFHDLLCVYLSGHQPVVKLAQKDTVLMQHAIDFLNEINNTHEPQIETAEMLKGCDAYIATGSNNTARYFEQYFAKYAHIIRQSKTSVAILTGAETLIELGALADDIYNYFGLGCRNVTKIYVPENYNFEALIAVLKTKTHISNHNKYKNNFDYNLALYLLNNQFYMTDGNILLVENVNLFSPIATLHYEFYNSETILQKQLETNKDIQAIVGKNNIAFGASQTPQISDFADGVDTMIFLLNI